MPYSKKKKCIFNEDETLLERLTDLPCLYDKRHKSYKEKVSRNVKISLNQDFLFRFLQYLFFVYLLINKISKIFYSEAALQGCS